MATATATRSELKLRPIGDRVIVQRIGSVEKTKSGLYLPDSAQEKPQEGKVIAVGSGRTLKTGKVVRTALQNAASIASLLITTESLVTEIPEKEKSAPAAPGGHGGEMY